MTVRQIEWTIVAIATLVAIIAIIIAIHPDDNIELPIPPETPKSSPARSPGTQLPNPATPTAPHP